MKLPDLVTFTGVDDATDLGRVAELSARYPVEWGVLFSPKRQGEEPRYPSLFAVGRVTHALHGRARLAAHICGGYAQSVVETGRIRPSLNTWLNDLFARFQINTAAAVDPAWVQDFAWDLNASGILQCRGDRFPHDPRVDWLFDRSGGKGLLPGFWPPFEELRGFHGFAGGINPDNVLAVVRDLAVPVDALSGYWIDMEAGVRTGDRFDLDKCEAVLRALYGGGR